jgi:signal-transduction protein with cAMP-binding, CBS, and nucleotidyltransferase domain
MSHSKDDRSKTADRSFSVQERLMAENTVIDVTNDSNDFEDRELTFDLKVDEPDTLKIMPDQADQLHRSDRESYVHVSHLSVSQPKASQPKARYIRLNKQGVFDHLSDHLKRILTQEGLRMRYLKNQAMNDIGESCKGLSLIMKGIARVDLMDALQWVSIDVLESGDMFGAMEWLEGKTWEERVIAVTEVETLFIDTDTLKKLSTRYPELRRQIERYTQRHHLQALLGTHDLFQQVAAQSLKYLIDLANLRPTRKGMQIFGPLMKISTLFVVGEGEVELRYNSQRLKVLREGDILNVELALGDGLNELSAYALNNGYLYGIPFEDIEVALARTGWLTQLQSLAQQRRQRAKYLK